MSDTGITVTTGKKTRCPTTASQCRHTSFVQEIARWWAASPDTSDFCIRRSINPTQQTKLDHMMEEQKARSICRDTRDASFWIHILTVSRLLRYAIVIGTLFNHCSARRAIKHILSGVTHKRTVKRDVVCPQPTVWRRSSCFHVFCLRFMGYDFRLPLTGQDFSSSIVRTNHERTSGEPNNSAMVLVGVWRRDSTARGGAQINVDPTI